MIPKIIHYCWFGGNPLPAEAEKCIASWKKYFPDYTIKRWDETNFHVHSCPYAREAYEAKKWAFVSDYARFWILYQEGGLYFDTDVEVIRDFTPILEEGAFMGCEAPAVTKKALDVAPGLGLGAPIGLPLYKEILEYYAQQHFLQADGSANLETVVGKTTRILQAHGYAPEAGGIQNVAGIHIYPPEYFCPMNYTTGELSITDKTCSIHHYAATWLEGYGRKELAIRYSLGKIIGHSAASLVGSLYSLPFRVAAKYKKLGLIGTAGFALSKMTRSIFRKTNHEKIHPQ